MEPEEKINISTEAAIIDTILQMELSAQVTFIKKLNRTIRENIERTTEEAENNAKALKQLLQQL
jgi:hypothetical protein